MAARPLAGRLTDTFSRTRTAAAGALLYALSCLGYAFAGSLPWALCAAAAGGIGGALFWIAVRAIAAEVLDTDSGSLAGLLSSESLGSWFFWIPAMFLLPAVGFSGVFTALAVACLAAALRLVLVPAAAPPPAPAAEAGEGGSRGSGLRPLLFLAALTAVAEAGVGLLLLLYLQNAVGLEIYQIGLVYLPGGIALTVLPRVLHRFTERRGRRNGYAAASVCSAIAAGCLAFTPSPLVIAALWVLTCASWAMLIPMHGAIVAETGTVRLGRGMALLSNAGLIGAAAGSLLAGFLYDGGSWLASCLVLGAVILSGAVLGPLVLNRMGVRDRPDSPAAETDPAITGSGPAAG